MKLYPADSLSSGAFIPGVRPPSYGPRSSLVQIERSRRRKLVAVLATAVVVIASAAAAIVVVSRAPGQTPAAERLDGTVPFNVAQRIVFVRDVNRIVDGLSTAGPWSQATRGTIVGLVVTPSPELGQMINELEGLILVLTSTRWQSPALASMRSLSQAITTASVDFTALDKAIALGAGDEGQAMNQVATATTDVSWAILNAVTALHLPTAEISNLPL